jgi:hypothetical protein
MEFRFLKSPDGLPKKKNWELGKNEDIPETPLPNKRLLVKPVLFYSQFGGFLLFE